MYYHESSPPEAKSNIELDQKFPDSWIEMPVLTTFDLVHSAKSILGITDDEFKHIDIDFLHKSDMSHPFLAYCDPILGEMDAIECCFIGIDYSNEGFYEAMSPKRIVHPMEEQFMTRGLLKSNRSPSLPCNLKSREEFLLYILFEELSHAFALCHAGNLNEIRRLKKNYEDYLITKGALKNHPYDIDVIEGMGNRSAVWAMSTYYNSLDPTRSNYFLNVYQAAVEQKVTPIPCLSNALVNLPQKTKLVDINQ